MTRQFSLVHSTVLGLTPPEMIYVAGKAGYDFVSILLIPKGLPNEPNYELSKKKEMMRQTKTALAETGIKLLDMELAKIYDGLDPKTYLPAMEVAAELGGTNILSSIWTKEYNFATECFSELCELAKPFGLTVDLEFVPFSEVKNLKEGIAILRAVNCENCGIVVDMLHFYYSRVAIEELDKVPREWFHFVHLCDAPAEIPATKEGLIYTTRQERLYPGEGGIDITAILNRIPEVPYAIEMPNIMRTMELGYEEYALRSIQTAKNYLCANLRK